MNRKKSIAIITARGGSKRIPGKNTKEFCGKPIIAYCIEAAVASECFDEVMVSTDSEKIAGISKKFGAKVPFMRSADTSNDYATTADVLLEVIREYRKRGVEFDNIFCLYPTSVFITEERIRNAINLFENNDADALIAVVKYGFPPQRSFIIQEGFLKYQYPEYERTRSQDLNAVYHDCGQFYICKTSAFLKYHSFVMPKSIPFPLSEDEVQDIDTITDWKLAEMKYLNQYFSTKTGLDIIRFLQSEIDGAL